MSIEPSPRARSMDHKSAPATGWNMGMVYWIGMLFRAGVLIFCLVRPRAGPSGLCAACDRLDILPRARGGRPRSATSASPLVPRPRGRARTPPHARRRNLRLAARALRMESPCPHSGDSIAPGPAYPPWNGLVRGNASAHGACFAIHTLLAAVALFTGHPWGALWILLPGVVVHLYPVLLQRSIMLRLQPLLDKPVRCRAVRSLAGGGRT